MEHERKPDTSVERLREIRAYHAADADGIELEEEGTRARFLDITDLLAMTDSLLMQIASLNELLADRVENLAPGELLEEVQACRAVASSVKELLKERP